MASSVAGVQRSGAEPPPCHATPSELGVRCLPWRPQGSPITRVPEAGCHGRQMCCVDDGSAPNRPGYLWLRTDDPGWGRSKTWRPAREAGGLVADLCGHVYTVFVADVFPGCSARVTATPVYGPERCGWAHASDQRTAGVATGNPGERPRAGVRQLRASAWSGECWYCHDLQPTTRA
jgi:hypothetical protein